VDAVYVMCESNMAVGKRHGLREQVRNEYGVRLEIIDGEAIAVQLTDRQNFWIARRFLDVPDALTPEGEQGPSWYAETKARWTQREQPPSTYGDLQELREAGRATVFGDAPKADVEFWLERLRALADPRGDHLRRAAFYQLAVLSLRGIETLHGLEEDIGVYFSHTEILEGQGELEDAEVLLTYVSIARRVGHVLLHGRDIESWRANLIARLEDQLAAAETPGRQCFLLMSLGSTYVVPAADGTPHPPDMIDKALNVWTRLVAKVDEAPFFPVGHLGQVMAAIAPLLVDRPGYASLVDSVDTKTSVQLGRSVAARTRRDRAMALLRSDRPLEALNEFHRVRLDWFAADTLRGSLLATIVMARCYENLGLFNAAKLYALATAGVALKAGKHDVLDLAGRATLVASKFDYEQGYTMGAVELTESGIALYDELNPAPWERDDEFRDSTFIHLFAPYGIAQRFEPAAVLSIRNALERNGLLSLADGGDDPWAEMSETAAAEEIVRQSPLDAVPFSDCGNTRFITWSGLGVKWEMTFPNEYETAIAAERFVAVAEIFTAHAAGEELCVLPTTIRISLTATGTETSVEHEMTGNGPLWHVNLCRGCGERALGALDVQAGTCDVVITLLMSASVLAYSEREVSFHRLIGRELLAKVTPGGLYDEFLALLVSKERWETSARIQCHPLGGLTSSPHELRAELSWRSDSGPTYAKEKANKFLENRYRHLVAATAITVRRLCATNWFPQVIEELRQEGWLDWHILNAINSVAGNYRAQLEASTEEEFNEAAKRWLWCVETDEAPVVPVSLFTLEALCLAYVAANLSCLKTWGLENSQEIVDTEAIDTFLRSRYAHGTDDVPHDDPFVLAT
jgi:hypothetical protein